MTGVAPVGAIDMGTNSLRVLVAEPGSGTGPLRVIERLMRITRLGQGVDATGRLADEAVERNLAVLREYREVLDRHGVERVRMAATSAARDATNREAFFDAVEDIVGARPELISGDEEGRLSFLGATAELDPSRGPFLVVDIGGGSTEFVVGTGGPAGEVAGVLSVDMGCVRTTESLLPSDPPAPEELSSALSIVQSHLDDVSRELPLAGEAETFIGVAGTITTVAAVEIGLPEYDREQIHHFHLTRAAAEDVFRTVATEKLEDRMHNPGLEPARADVIVGGALVLVGIFRYFGFDECLVSEADILDGLIRSQL